MIPTKCFKAIGTGTTGRCLGLRMLVQQADGCEVRPLFRIGDDRPYLKTGEADGADRARSDPQYLGLSSTSGLATRAATRYPRCEGISKRLRKPSKLAAARVPLSQESLSP